MDSTYEDMIRFHGHSCPGLAIGYRMTKAGLDYLHRNRAQDEEIVAIVDKDKATAEELGLLMLGGTYEHIPA